MTSGQIVGNMDSQKILNVPLYRGGGDWPSPEVSASSRAATPLSTSGKRSTGERKASRKMATVVRAVEKELSEKRGEERDLGKQGAETDASKEGKVSATGS